MERLHVDGLGDILHIRLFQHSLCMAGCHLLCDSITYGDLRWRQRLLQQILRPRPTIYAHGEQFRVVTQESRTEMVIVQVVPQRISRLLHVFLCADDLANRAGFPRTGFSATDRTLAVDFQCSLALGLPHSHRTLAGAICFRTVRHNADFTYRWNCADRNLPASHMVCVLPDGQHDPTNMQT